MSEVEKRPAGTLTPERRYGIAISVALILGGAWWALTDLTEDTHTSEQAFVLSGPTLTIDARSADVEIRTGDGSEVTVTQRFRRNVFGSDPKNSYRDGRLEIGGGSCGPLSFDCKTSYVVVVPKDKLVTAHNSSGKLEASDLAGADLTSSSGGIEVHRISGDLKLVTSSGDIGAFDVGARTVRAVASSGNVELTFDAAPTEVEARTSSGDVVIEVPRDDGGYQVQTKTSSGEELVKVKEDAAAERTLKGQSSSGDVSIDYSQN